MNLYTKIDNQSLLLDKEFKKMLRRSSRKLIICEVLEKISNGSKKNTIYIDTSNNKIKNKNFFEFILNLFGCNIN